MYRASVPDIVLALTLGALIATLGIFYQKTQALDLREKNEVLDLLRNLKDIDSRWDVDVLRARTTPALDVAPRMDRSAAANKVLQTLNQAAQATPSPALSAGLPDLARAITQKAELIARFSAENAAAKSALRTIVQDSAAASEQGVAKARASDVERIAPQITSAALLYYWLGQAAHGELLQSTAKQLRAAPHTAAVGEAIDALITHRDLEQDLYTRLAFLTSGPRLDNLTFSYSRELEDTLQEKERYRVYLIAYAAALLIVLAYLGAKLKAANVTLERRVVERTRELSEALLHLKESEAQLIQSEKMSSLGQMVAGIAHEINTPLAYVKNSLGTVSDKLADLKNTVAHCDQLVALLQKGGSEHADELKREFRATSAQLKELRRNRVLEELPVLVKDGLYGSAQMSEIIGNLKNFSRLDRSKVADFNLNEGLDSTLLLAKHELKAVDIHKHYGEIPHIVCSPSQVNQVFLNLITNAIQAFEGKKGNITLTTRTGGGGVFVDIGDNGKGIAPDVLPKIFDPFFSTKEIGKGTGLGLSISYKIVQEHGGRITVESEAGRGTTFTVWLPLKPPAQAQQVV